MIPNANIPQARSNPSIGTFTRGKSTPNLYPRAQANRRVGGGAELGTGRSRQLQIDIATDKGASIHGTAVSRGAESALGGIADWRERLGLGTPPRSQSSRGAFSGREERVVDVAGLRREEPITRGPSGAWIRRHRSQSARTRRDKHGAREGEDGVGDDESWDSEDDDDDDESSDEEGDPVLEI